MGWDVGFAAGTHAATVKGIEAKRCAYWLSMGTNQASRRTIQEDEKKIEGLVGVNLYHNMED